MDGEAGLAIQQPPGTRLETVDFNDVNDVFHPWKNIETRKSDVLLERLVSSRISIRVKIAGYILVADCITTVSLVSSNAKSAWSPREQKNLPERIQKRVNR